MVLVLIVAAMPLSAPTAPTARLNRPVPAVRSAITMTVSTFEDLPGNEERIVRGDGEDAGADRLHREADQQERPAPALLRMEADPRRQKGNHELRRHNQAGHPQRRAVRVGFREVFADHRQHRSVGKLEEHQRTGEEDEPPVLRQIDDPRERHFLLAGSGIARLGVVDLLAADGAQRDQGRNAKGRGREENGAGGKVGARHAHQERAGVGKGTLAGIQACVPQRPRVNHVWIGVLGCYRQSYDVAKMATWEV